MAHKPNFTAQLTNKEAVRKVAASIGGFVGRGPFSKEGSIRHMLEDIGGGDILVFYHPYDDGSRMREEAGRIREIAKDYVGEYLGETLEALARALEVQAEAFDD